MPLLHSIPGAQEELGGVSRSVLYELMANGAIRPVKIGRRTYISQAELERYVQSLGDGGVSSVAARA